MRAGDEDTQVRRAMLSETDDALLIAELKRRGYEVIRAADEVTWLWTGEKWVACRYE